MNAILRRYGYAAAAVLLLIGAVAAMMAARAAIAVEPLRALQRE